MNKESLELKLELLKVMYVGSPKELDKFCKDNYYGKEDEMLSDMQQIGHVINSAIKSRIVKVKDQQIQGIKQIFRTESDHQKRFEKIDKLVKDEGLFVLTNEDTEKLFADLRDEGIDIGCELPH